MGYEEGFSFEIILQIYNRCTMCSNVFENRLPCKKIEFKFHRVNVAKQKKGMRYMKYELDFSKDDLF